MRIMVAGDIHGSEYYCKKLCQMFECSKAQILLLLGDILYHGPRNPLPRGYDPQGVCRLLNPLSDRIICVQGNCDSEVDGMVLDFPLLAQCAYITDSQRIFFATHGHVFNSQNLPPLQKGCVLLHAHTHVPAFVFKDDHICINPGSVSLPKQDTPNSFAVIDGDSVVHYDIDGNTFMQNKLPRL